MFPRYSEYHLHPIEFNLKFHLIKSLLYTYIISFEFKQSIFFPLFSPSNAWMWASAVYKATLLSAFYCLIRYFYFSCSALHWEAKLNGTAPMVWKLRKRRNVRDLYISLNAFKHNVIVSWWQRKREEKRNRLNNLMEKEVFNLKWVCKFIPSHFSCISSVCVLILERMVPRRLHGWHIRQKRGRK